MTGRLLGRLEFGLSACQRSSSSERWGDIRRKGFLHVLIGLCMTGFGVDE